MATQVRIEFKSEGFREILCSDATQSLMSEQASTIAARAGDGFEPDTFMGGYGGGRWCGVVRTDTTEARRAEAEDMVLSRAVY